VSGYDIKDGGSTDCFSHLFGIIRLQSERKEKCDRSPASSFAVFLPHNTAYAKLNRFLIFGASERPPYRPRIPDPPRTFAPGTPWPLLGTNAAVQLSQTPALSSIRIFPFDGFATLALPYILLSTVRIHLTFVTLRWRMSVSCLLRLASSTSSVHSLSSGQHIALIFVDLCPDYLPH